MKLNPNHTVWQRLNGQLQEYFGKDNRAEADALTKILHPYVIAERKDAQS